MDLGLGKAEEQLDYIVRDHFEEISDDPFFGELFCSYFKNRIVKGSFSSFALYLTDDEKTLQYAGRNTVEPIAEYVLLINAQEYKSTKRHYAEKGAVFAIVQPTLQKVSRSERNYYATSARQFYSVVATYSDHKEMQVFFDFLSEQATVLIDGLEVVIENIQKSGEHIRERLYEEVYTLYQAHLLGPEGTEYARQLISLSRTLGINGDELPLHKKHYRLLFE